jgi:excisionase family DNA binding protein
MAKADAIADIELIAYTIEQAAAALGLDKERVSNLVRVGVIPHIALGGRRLIGKRALEHWLTDACLANARTTEIAAPSRLTPLRRRAARGGPRSAV